MELIENPTGIVIKVKLEGLAGAKRPVYTPDDIIAMRAGTGKMVHILDQDSPKTFTYQGQQYYYAGNALCGAGRPSKTYPQGSSRSIGAGGMDAYGSPIERNYLSKGGKPLPITISCYRCLKIHALNKGPVFERDFAPTTEGHTLKHDMLPGGREGFYGEGDYGKGRDLWAKEKVSPGLVDKEIREAAVDREYWGEDRELFRVGAPYARTQPETIEPYQATARRFGFEDPKGQVGTTPKTDILSKGSRKTKPNPALKVGDRIAEGGRKGTVKAFHSKGTVDVKFDDMDYVIRRQLPMVKRLNPDTRAQIQEMINTAPSSWKTMFKRYKLGSKPSVGELIQTVLEFTPSMNKYGRKGAKVYSPPPAVRSNALKGLKLSHRHNYTSASGIGLVRAMQLATEPKVWKRTVERMDSYFERHQKDKQSSRFGNQISPSRGYMAWLNWGGDEGYRWSSKLLRKEAPMVKRLNPSKRVQGIIYENYNPFTAQFTAQVQGIYESEVRKALKKKSTTKFKNAKTGARLDAKLSHGKIRKLLSTAFAIATRVGQKQGYLRKGTHKPTAKGRKRAQERQKDTKHLWENILDYETTLYLSRKKKESRILKKGLRYYIMPSGDYALSLSAAIKRIQDKGGKKKKAVNPRRRRNAKKKIVSPVFGTKTADRSDKQIRVYAARKPFRIREKGKEVMVGWYIDFMIEGPRGAFAIPSFNRYHRMGLREADISAFHYLMKTPETPQFFGSPQEMAIKEKSFWARKWGKTGYEATPQKIEILEMWKKIPDRKGRRLSEGQQSNEISLWEMCNAIALNYNTKFEGDNPTSAILENLYELKDLGLIETAPPQKKAASKRIKKVRKELKNAETMLEKAEALVKSLSSMSKSKKTKKEREYKEAKKEAEEEVGRLRAQLHLEREKAKKKWKFPANDTLQWMVSQKGKHYAERLDLIQSTRGGSDRNLNLYNPLFVYKEPRGLRKPEKGIEIIEVGGEKLKVETERIVGKQITKFRATPGEIYYEPYSFDYGSEKRWNSLAERKGDRGGKLKWKEVCQALSMALTSYAKDNRMKKKDVQDMLLSGQFGDTGIPGSETYLQSLTLIQWSKVGPFLLNAYEKGYTDILLSALNQSKIAKNVIGYAQIDIPLPSEGYTTTKKAFPTRTQKTFKKGKKKEKEGPTQTLEMTGEISFGESAPLKKKTSKKLQKEPPKKTTQKPKQPKKTTRQGDKRVEKIVSGGQTGADQGGLEAAVQLRIPTGGWIPKGFKIRTAPRTDSFDPSLKKYGLKETKEATYPPRRKKNIEMADATLIYAVDAKSPGTKGTKKDADERRKPVLIIDPTNHGEAVKATLDFMKRHRPTVLNVAGNAEYRSTGIQQQVRDILIEALSGKKPTRLARPPLKPKTRFKTVEGDLFDYVGKADAIGITTNLQTNDVGFARMGAGIAKAADRKYHLRAPYGKLLTAGVTWVIPIKEVRDTVILAVPTKNYPSKPSPPALVERSLQQLVILTAERGWKNVAIPLLGAGLGKLPMTTLKPLLEKYLDDRFTVVVLPQKKSAPKRKTKPKTKAAFRGKYDFLSNMYPTKLTITNQHGTFTFDSAEAMFQASKFDPNQWTKFVGIDGYEAKKLGRKIRLSPKERAEWDRRRLKAMEAVLHLKFSNPTLKSKLKATGNEPLIEENTWGDKFWGTVNGQGDNHLGEILMKIRNRIQ